MLVHEAQRLCPGLICVPPDHDFYEQKSREVMKILRRYSPLIEQNSIDEAWMDITGCELLFGKPEKIARKIMEDIQKELDLWCSIGISENKFLAKMASELKKPLGITTLWQEEVKEKLWPLRVRDMYGVGKQTETKLSNLAIFTVGDLARSNKTLLAKHFGKYGEELHRLANGFDPAPVEENPRHENKSISRSVTLPQDITHVEQARTVLLRLAEEVGMEARAQGEKGKTISITIKYNDFQSITRQKSLRATYLTRDIYQTGIALLQANWNSSRPVRLLGIGLSNFQSQEIQQLSIFDMNNCGEAAENKEEKIEKAVDDIRKKYGMDKIQRAKMIIK